MTTTTGEASTGDGRVPPRRSRRLFALPSGIVLVVAIFLPVVKVCGDPAYPIQVPFVWGPYVLGGLVIAMALAGTARGLRGLVITAQAIVALQWGGFGLAMFQDVSGAPWGLLLLAAVVAFWYGTRRGDREQGAANAVIGIGLVCLPWFALFAFDKDGMWGAWVSLGAALAVIGSGLEWRRELRLARTEPVPTARVVA
ncbi:MAG: hypothetical protein K8W52_31780 [Deltaproteobacteria bacterium]|nr:hypothetical protein [Deltaproteobacteria bacterium]